MGYKSTDQCIQKAFEDERLFVLMSGDVNAPIAVLEWIKASLYNQPEEKLREAFECALEMKKTRAEFIKRKEAES